MTKEDRQTRRNVIYTVCLGVAWRLPFRLRAKRPFEESAIESVRESEVDETNDQEKCTIHVDHPSVPKWCAVCSRTVLERSEHPPASGGGPANESGIVPIWVRSESNGSHL